MTGDDVNKARLALGQLWGLGRKASAAELGRVLGLRGRDPGETVIGWEKKPADPVTGPVALAIAALLDGWRPAELEARLGRKIPAQEAPRAS